MKFYDADMMFRGWFIGDFEPAAYRTANFEVGILSHKRGERWAAHYHEHADEINYLLEGSMSINGELIEAPCIFVISRGEVADPEFLTDCKLVVVKTPSRPGDKIIVNNGEAK